MAKRKKNGGIDDYLEERRDELERIGTRFSPTTTVPSRPRGSVQKKVTIGPQGRRLQMGVGGTASRRHANRPKPPGASKKKY